MIKQRGGALLIVLLIVALVVTLAVNMGGRLQLQVVRTQNLQESEQGYWYMRSAEALVQQVLNEEIEAEDGVVHLNQQWANQESAFPVAGGGVIQGQIKDLRSCLNVNSLDSNGANYDRRRAQFKALFVALEIDDYTADVMVDSLADWMDEDDRITGTYGAEDPDYEALPIPYRAANVPLVDITELRLVRGFTRDIYRTVKPYLCVIPGERDGVVNINTIPIDQPQILVAMFEGRLDLSDATSVLADRPENGFDDVNEFTSDPAIATALQQGGQNAPQTPSPNGNDGEDENDNGDNGSESNGVFADFDVTSEYFELRGWVRYGELLQSGTSQLRLDGNSASVIYRK